MPFNVLFDDGAPLAPLTDLRPVYRVRTGVVTTAERWAGVLGGAVDGVVVPARLADLEREAVAGAAVNPDLGSQGDVLLVNGACVLPVAVQGLGMDEWIADERGGLLAARLHGSAAQRFLLTGETPTDAASSIADNGPLLTRLCDVIRLRDRAMTRDLHHLAPSPTLGALPEGVVTIGKHPIVCENAAIGPGTVLDASGGAIYLAPGVTVRPRSSLIGPCAVLGASTVMDGAVVRPHTVIGPACKVGGEVGGTIFQGHANKAHDGYLGDSYVGEWVNLGAATNNSNLLNTYGEVKAAPRLGEDREPTGLTFFGCVIGDHAKTAIGTRIGTGSVIGTGAMLAMSGWPPVITERFLWLTDGEPSRYRWARFEEVAGAVMARRGVAPGAAYMRTLRDLHGEDAQA